MSADPLVFFIDASDRLDEWVAIEVRVHQFKDAASQATLYRARSDAYGKQGDAHDTVQGAINHLIQAVDLKDHKIRPPNRTSPVRIPSGARRELRVITQEWINRNHDKRATRGPRSIARLAPGARLALHWFDETVTREGNVDLMRERSIHLDAGGAALMDLIRQLPDGSWSHGTGALQAILDCSEPAPVRDFDDFALLHDIDGPTAILALRRLFDDIAGPQERQSLLWLAERDWAPMNEPVRPTVAPPHPQPTDDNEASSP